MSGKYQTYPAYKDSGVEWLGDVPEHWEITRVKFITECLDGSRIPLNAQERGDMQGDIPYWGANNIVDYVNDFLFDEDLILLGEDGAPFFDKTKNVAFNVSGKLWANNHVHVLRPEKTKIECRFLKHALNCADFYLYISGSTRDKLNQYDMNQIQIRICPLSEQQKIAQFLDHETAKIDTLIEKQQRLIELLKEKRQAVISHAVTKGLNSNAPMKESGVKWLGDVPEGWEVKPIKYICNLIDGDRSSFYPNENDLVDDGIPFVSSKNIVNYKLTKKNLNYITREKFERLSQGKLIAGDLVITVRGTIGHVGIFDPEIIGCETGFINAQMMILRPINGLTDYLQLISESSLWQSQLDVAAYGSTVKQLSNEVLGSICIAIPPSNELSNFVNYVKQCCEKIERLIFHANSAIELMQERRTALISAAVTGKIDVREWENL
jgi:type I restriction enzyme S subunit